VDTIENYFDRYAERFDLVLFTEVIEHFDKSQGLDTVKLVQQLVTPGGCLLITTPAAYFEQGPEYGNQFERHLSLWTEHELRELGFETEIVGDQRWFCGETIVGKWKQP